MKLNFRQGIVKGSQFLELEQNTNSISLITNESEVIATAAYGSADYLIKENSTVPRAWGPLEWNRAWGTEPSNTVTYHLYWNISMATGRLTRGFTPLAQVVSATEPAKIIDLHWFDTASMMMKVYTGTGWRPVIRVFAGTSTPVEKSLGSQVGITSTTPSYSAGYIMFGGDLKGIKLNSGEFMTTESTVVLQQGSFTSPVQFESLSNNVIANEPIPAFSCVYVSEPSKINLASGLLEAKWAVGVVSRNINPGEYASLITSNMLYNEQWNWDLNLGKELYCSEYGELIQTNPLASNVTTQKIASIIDEKTILVSIDRTGPKFGVVGPTGPAGAGSAGNSNPYFTATSTGELPLAAGDDSISVGPGTVADGNSSIAIGKDAAALHDNSIAIGDGATSVGNESLTVGADGRYWIRAQQQIGFEVGSTIFNKEASRSSSETETSFATNDGNSIRYELPNITSPTLIMDDASINKTLQSLDVGATVFNLYLKQPTVGGIIPIFDNFEFIKGVSTEIDLRPSAITALTVSRVEDFFNPDNDENDIWWRDNVVVLIDDILDSHTASRVETVYNTSGFGGVTNYSLGVYSEFTNTTQDFLTDTCTVEGKFNVPFSSEMPNTTPLFTNLEANGYGFTVYVEKTGSLVLTCNNETISIPGFVFDELFHVAVVHNSGSMNLFYNGALGGTIVVRPEDTSLCSKLSINLTSNTASVDTATSFDCLGFRATRGVLRYLSNFDSASVTFPSYETVKFLVTGNSFISADKTQRIMIGTPGV